MSTIDNIIADAATIPGDEVDPEIGESQAKGVGTIAVDLGIESQSGETPDVCVVMRALPDRDVMALVQNPFSKQQWLLNRITGENKLLIPPTFDGDGFSLEFDDDGTGILSCDEIAEYASDSFDKVVYGDAMGKRMVVDYTMDADGGKPTRQWLVDLQRDHKVGEVYFPTALRGCRAKVRVAIFDMLICGSSVFWDIGQVHTICGFSSYSSYPTSLWVHKQLPRWEKQVRCLGFPIGHLKSMPYRNIPGDGAEDSAPGRILRFVSVPSYHLVWRLLCFAFASRVAGGLASEGDRLAAAAFMRCFLAATHGTQWLLCLFLDGTGMQFDEFIGPVKGADPVCLTVKEDGVVDLSPMRVDEASAATARTLRSLFADEIPEQIGLYDFCAASMRHRGDERVKGSDQLASQVAWQLGAEVERRILSGGFLKSFFEFAQPQVDWSRSNGLRDRTLVGYLAASCASLGPLMSSTISVSTDCSRVGGLQIMNSVVIASNGVGAWMPPQAAMQARGVGGARAAWASRPSGLCIGPLQRDGARTLGSAGGDSPQMHAEASSPVPPAPSWRSPHPLGYPPRYLRSRWVWVYVFFDSCAKNIYLPFRDAAHILRVAWGLGPSPL